ncbi:MAG: uracil-DNA glycosylase [Clostridia bacterium]|nr:uracil-DNA glycosylase [Clostridia bacterium]MDD4047391.1 uracil-DNA glycosylase [Clostridia bacterium]
MTKTEEIKKLQQIVEDCDKCTLRKGCQKVVFGAGNPEAKIMLIGEGPGAEEDKTGMPFVGRAGQLLDKILEACGFNRKDHIYIANIVKCRPPKNRVPSPEERAACLPYLKEQINIIEPKIIILLGATALQGLIDPQAKITKMRGDWIKFQNICTMPTYHPAALLRNPRLKAPAWEDYKKVVQKYRELVNHDHYSAQC